MQLKLTILRPKGSAVLSWEAELQGVLSDWNTENVESLEFSPGEEVSLGQVVLVDSAMDGLEDFLASIDRGGRALILVVDEASQSTASGQVILPQSLLEGRVDDVLVRPFRLSEVLGKFRIYEQILMQSEVQKINESFTDLIGRLHDDLKLAERLQKSRLPTRFKDPKGFRIQSRYLAGLKQGGEFFDLADSAQGDRWSLLLTDSSTYGLSSAVLSVLMRVTAKLTGADARSCFETVKLIYDELMLTLGEKDHLSLFYGMVSRKDLSLKYLNLGSSRAFHARSGGSFEELAPQGDPISRASGLKPTRDLEKVLNPEDRLVLVSDGFLMAAGGANSTVDLLNRLRKSEPADVLNELVFKVKSQLKSDDDMPEQDCTGVIVDVDAKFLRIARA